MKSKPLYQQALEGELGDSQYNDLETLNWFKSITTPRKIPISDIFEDYVSMSDRKFNLLVPQVSSFRSIGHTNTIHGMSHILRVMLYANILHQYLQEEIVSLQDLLIAAVVHDLRRINDRGDTNHGRRAGEWFIDNIDLFRNLNPTHPKAIEWTVSRHNLPAGNKHEGSKYEKKLLGLLQMADALDRYRLPKEKWWPKNEYFQIKLPQELFDFAKYFTYRSELEALDKGNQVSAVRAVASELEIINGE